MKKEIRIEEMPGFESKVEIGKLNIEKDHEIFKDEILFSMEGAKCSEDFISKFNGRIIEVFVSDGDEVEKGQLIAIIELEEDDIKDIVIKELPGFDTFVSVSNIGFKVGDKVRKDDILLSVEGSKCCEDIKATYDGEIVELLVKEKDEIEKDTLLSKIKVDDITDKGIISREKISKKCRAEVVVLGGGPGGYVAAIRASQNGKNVILIEKDELGGTCLNRGCIPTKSMVQSTKVSDIIKKAEIFGIEDASGLISMEKIIDRKNNVVNTLVSGLNSSMKKHKINVIKGEASINDEKSLIVDLGDDKTVVEFENLILAPGSIVSIPNFIGAEEEDILTSDELLELREIPESIIIIGGRVIAMEFAFIYSKLGSKVTVIQRSNTIFPNLDSDVIDVIQNSARKHNIRLIEGADLKEIKTNIDGYKTVIIEKNNNEEFITAHKVAIATGRKANIENLELEKMNVDIDNQTKGIKVNKKLETTAENIYAIGDATNIYNLAHVASKHGIIAADNICGKNIEMRYDAVPEAVFTDPEIGLVGMNEKECISKGINYIIGKFPYMANGKALVEDETDGFIKLVANTESREIIGASLVGLAATDLLSSVTNLVHNKVKIDDAKDVIYAHPTVSETLFEAILDLDNESIHK